MRAELVSDVARMERAVSTAERALAELFDEGSGRGT